MIETIDVIISLMTVAGSMFILEPIKDGIKLICKQFGYADPCNNIMCSIVIGSIAGLIIFSPALLYLTYG